MIFQLLVLALIGGLVFFLSLQGLYSAAIMAVCSILALLTAFNYAEPLAGGMANALPEMADGLALMLLFLAVLFALRFLADRYLPGMVHFPYLADRIGGGVIGIVPALIIAGVLTIGWQLLPMGASMMGYHSFTPAPTAKPGEQPEPEAEPQVPPGDPPKVAALWLAPDRFTVTLVERLSAGAFSGPQRFDQVHPNYRLEVAGFSQVARPASRQARADALENLQVQRVDARGKTSKLNVKAPARWVTALGDVPPELLEDRSLALPDTEGKPVELDGDRLLRVRLLFEAKENLDADGQFRLSPGQVQLVCRAVDEQGNPRASAPGRLAMPAWLIPKLNDPTQFEPLDMNRLWQVKVERKTAPLVTEFLFKVPAGYRPWFLRVRRRTVVPVAMLEPTDVIQEIKPAIASVIAKGQWPVHADDWSVEATSTMPIALRAQTPPAGGLARTNVPGGQLTLDANGRVTRAKLIGPKRNFTIMMGADRITAFAAAPDHQLVLVEGRISNQTLYAAMRINLLNAEVEVSRGEPHLTVAGVYAVTDSNRWLLLYDRGAAPGHLRGVNLDELTVDGHVVRFGYIVSLPQRQWKFTIHIGAERTLEVNVPRN